MNKARRRALRSQALGAVATMIETDVTNGEGYLYSGLEDLPAKEREVFDWECMAVAEKLYARAHKLNETGKDNQ